MFGKCKVCEAKDAHIRDLQNLLRVPTSATMIPELALEADMVLGGVQQQLRITPAETAEAERVNAEASQLLSGMWDEAEMGKE